MADWVPLLENHNLSYEIEIPETEYMTRVDSTAYTRILNNLLQNILTHSDASKVFLTVTETEQQAKIVVADNATGLPPLISRISLNGCINAITPALPKGTAGPFDCQRVSQYS